MSGMLGLLFKKMRLPPGPAVNGKTVLITGANTGIGKEAARHALAMGAGQIIMGVRTLSKGEQAKTDIVRSVSASTAHAGKVDGTNIFVWEVDLESFDSVRTFAERVKKHVETDGGQLDIAIMNAGLATTKWAQSPTGWEKSLQVNVLSTALLSLHLLPLLLATHKRFPASLPHLSILTSDIHKSIKFSERDQANILSALNDESRWAKSQAAGGATERYGVSKLFDLFIATKLSEITPRDSGSGSPLVVVNAVTPGFCKSDLMTREDVPLMLKVVEALIARTATEGSKTLLHAAAAGPETAGKWLENQSITDPGPLVTSPQAAVVREKVWGEIIDVLREVDPTVPTHFA